MEQKGSKTTTHQGTQKKYTAPALEKGLEIIELLSKAPDGLNLTDISAQLGRTKTEIFRMVAVLTDHEYLEYFAQERLYRLSLKLFRISHRYAPIQQLSTISLPIMKKLSNTIRHSCHMVVYSEGGGLIINHQDPDSNNNRLTLPVGGRGPLVNNCAGHVLLAFASYEVKERMMNAYQAHSDSAPINQRKLREDLQRVKNQGFEAMESPVLAGVFDTGFPIFDRYDNAAAVLMVSMLLYRDNARNTDQMIIKKHIRQATTEISEKIGYHAEHKD